MSCAAKKNLMISLLLLPFYFVPTENGYVFPLSPFKVVIRSGFDPKGPSSLSLKCYSDADGLEFRVLKSGEEFSWKFRMDFFFGTIFRCNFGYNNHWQKGFVVFDSNIAEYPWTEIKGTYVCFWYVKEGGFYMGYEYPSVAPQTLNWKGSASWTPNETKVAAEEGFTIAGAFQLSLASTPP
ncbi:uncharacterized protein LOC113780722 [Coffea eugenioides]|uniref:uncharacterized protein LOC113780722 n=1 Tax=Coffea eugenioides TaxID=49369 RepID=UPI000F609A96|nr:uncharacterized protein LOC113780722 [Coffea eugenioides]